MNSVHKTSIFSTAAESMRRLHHGGKFQLGKVQGERVCLWSPQNPLWQGATNREGGVRSIFIFTD